MANEKRLIDAKAGKKVFSAIAQPAEYKGVLHMVVPISEIDKLPTVDAVEVVRCKDCHWWRLVNKRNGCGICSHEVFSIDDCTVDPVIEPNVSVPTENGKKVLTMAEYIEREALKKVLTRYLNAPHVQMGDSVGKGMRIAIKSCIELLDNEYAADVAPVVHGRWQQIGYDEAMNRITCSCCLEYWNITDNDTETFNYCPNCGAKMDLEE